jgi:hypothetical protein
MTEFTALQVSDCILSPIIKLADNKPLKALFIKKKKNEH